MKQLFALGVLSLLGVVLILPTIGCGGSSSVTTTSTGRATVAIAWPEVSRLIPTASRSITVKFLQGSDMVATQTVTRPDVGGVSALDFSGLPAGSLSVTATAYPNADGTGAAQATATVAATIIGGQSVPISLTLASTISTLSMAGNLTLPAGTTTGLAADAQNSAGGIVLIAASNLTWTSSNTGVATVSATGLVTGLTPGTTQIRVTESESGKSVTATVTVSEPISVSITPATLTLSIRGTQYFSARVANTTNQNVTWSMQESRGGTITNLGFYTAPSAAGTYHVIATSTADPTRTATATVTVQSGSASVIVN